MNFTPHESMFWGPALLPQSVAAAGTANGPRIIDPARFGRHLSIFLSLPALTGVTAFTARLAGSNDNGTSWAPVKKNDGLTDLAFTGAKFIAGGAYSALTAIGTIQLERGKYKDYRLEVTQVTGAAVILSATYFILPLWKMPAGLSYPGTVQNALGQNVASGGNVDEWLNDFLPTGST